MPTDESGQPAETQTPEPTPAPEPFEPHAVDSTQPSNFISYTNVMVNDTLLDGTYTAEQEINFGAGSEYSALPGVITFGHSAMRGWPVQPLPDQ